MDSASSHTRSSSGGLRRTTGGPRLEIAAASGSRPRAGRAPSPGHRMTAPSRFAPRAGSRTSQFSASTLPVRTAQTFALKLPHLKTTGSSSTGSPALGRPGSSTTSLSEAT